MPWKITKGAEGCNGFAVVKEGTNTPIPGGCHKTRAEAIKHLIAIRIGYGEREQPRDPDGKFASTGGSKDRPSKGRPIGGVNPDDITAGKTVAKAVGNKNKSVTLSNGKTVKVASKMKDAPKNVTGKGVNQDAEYVQSAKTGNVFVNPQWNGNPAGAGKVSLNGKDKFGGAKTQMVSYPPEFPNSPSGTPAKFGKYIETGQNKHLPDDTVTTSELGNVPIVGYKLQKVGSDAPSAIPSSGKLAKPGTPQVKISKAPPPTPSQQAAFKDRIEKQIASQKAMETAEGQTSTHKKITPDRNLTSTEQNAIVSYTGSSYVSMNGTLRQSHGLATNSKIDAAQKGLMKNSLQEDVVLSRQISIKQSAVGKLQPGDEIYDPGFQSTSTAAKWAGNTQLRVYAPKGTKGMSVQNISRHGSEMEVLLPAGATYRIMNITRTEAKYYTKTVIDVEIVEQGIRPGVAATLEGNSLRARIVQPAKFTMDMKYCAVNGVFPDGFRLTA